MTAMTIASFDPSTATEADVVGVHAVRAAALALDRPEDPAPRLEEIRFRLGHNRADWRRHWFLARAGGEIIGYAVLRLPLLDNQHLGYVELTVTPGHRRTDIGTALLLEVVAAQAAEGRRLLVAETTAGTAGDPFARAIGARLVQTARMSLLRLADVDWADVEQVAADKHQGYRIAAHVGRCPDELLDSYARAKSAMNDAPFDDADVTDFVYTTDTIRADETAAAGHGEGRVVFAVHEETGEVAAFTEILSTGRPLGSQSDTAVVPAHRGHGLGLWVKAEMLLRLRVERPEMTMVMTGNSATNAHMLRINDRLGYRPWSQLHGWQVETAALATRLG
jgi:GNAT superfamily N-acetyltransferase